MIDEPKLIIDDLLFLCIMAIYLIFSYSEPPTGFLHDDVDAQQIIVFSNNGVDNFDHSGIVTDEGEEQGNKHETTDSSNWLNSNPYRIVSDLPYQERSFAEQVFNNTSDNPMTLTNPYLGDFSRTISTENGITEVEDDMHPGPIPILASLNDTLDYQREQRSQESTLLSSNEGSDDLDNILDRAIEIVALQDRAN